MRRFAGVFAVLLLLAPAGLRVTLTDAESEALRCAIACGHPAKAGAACCPMSGLASKAAAMASCPTGEAPSMAPSMPAQPALFASIDRLARPDGDSLLFSPPSATPRDPPVRLLDHIPLLVS